MTVTGRPGVVRPHAPRASQAELLAASALSVALVAAAIWLPMVPVGGALTVIGLLVLFRRFVFSWRGALIGFVAVLMFIPVRKVKLAIPLPFALEPYRFLLVLIALAIVFALLVNVRFRWQRVEFGASFGALFGALIASIGFNAVSLTENGYGGLAVSALGSYVIIAAAFFVTRQLLRSARMVELLLRLLVIGGAVVGFGAVIERATRENIFLRLAGIPGLTLMTDEQAEIIRSGGARSFGSAQHPIGLAVLLTMLVALAIYLARHDVWPKRPNRRSLFYVGCALLMLVGVICSVSRTSFIMLGAMVVLAVLMRPQLLLRLVFVGLPLAAVASLVSPNAVISMLYAFTQPEKLIASQHAAAGWRGSGRLADLGPALTEFAASPFFGTGIGSRIVVGPLTNAGIMDNQWLTTLLETGIVGVLAIAALVVVPTVRLLRFAGSARSLRAVQDPELARLRDLACALGIAMAGYVVSMFFFDAFSFLQSIMVFFVLMAIGAWVLQRARALQSGTAPREADAILA